MRQISSKNFSLCKKGSGGQKRAKIRYVGGRYMGDRRFCDILSDKRQFLIMLFDDTEYGPYGKAERKARKAFELYEEGKVSLALSELEDALEINPSNGSWHFNKGLVLDTVNRFEDAINEYEIALQSDPADPEILNSLAVDYTRTGQYDLAINMFEYIEKIEPTFEPGYCNRIITYTEMGQQYRQQSFCPERI